jgi:F0F1-type ATP synthase membrane subunit c/vacuolar-type H+-ATPase subunit K
MLQTTVFFLSALTAATGMIATAFYILCCFRKLAHSASPCPDVHEENEASWAWTRKGWAIESVRTRCALVVIACYATSMGLSMWLRSLLESAQNPTLQATVVTLISTATLMTMSLYTLFYNGRIDRIETRRRYPDLYRDR